MSTGGNAARQAPPTSTRAQARGAALPVWGERVALERLALDLTQTELGEKVGVSRDTIARIERGSRRVRDELRCDIAAVFDLRPEVLFPYGIEPPRRARGPRRRAVTADDVPRTAVA